MPVIAVINRKGGSGKSTVAAHLAAWLAHQGATVMLGDVDRQQSTRTWLKRRNAALPSIMPWATDKQNVLKVPTGVTHVVLDTPGGMHGFELAKVIMSADAIIMPVCSSVFDRESAAGCYAELMVLPRVSSGRCKIGIVGMRIDPCTHSGQMLREWSESLKVPFLGVLRETELYVKCLENGQTLFDQPASAVSADLAQWEPILQWLAPITKLSKPEPKVNSADLPAVQAAASKALQSVRTVQRISAPRAASLMPAQETMVPGDRLSIIAAARPTPVVQQTEVGFAPERHSRPLDSEAVPHFLLRRH
jgi:chromosome partitioning protein